MGRIALRHNQNISLTTSYLLAGIPLVVAFLLLETGYMPGLGLALGAIGVLILILLSINFKKSVSKKGEKL